MPRKESQNGHVGRTARERAGMLNFVRKMVLASVGVVGVAQDELKAFLDRLVERGEITEQDAGRLLTDVRKQLKKHRQAPELDLEKQIEALLEKMNIPSQADIVELSHQVSQLSKRVEELKAQMHKA